MVWNRMDLKNFAKESMRRNFGACVLVAFLLSLILGLDISSTSRLEELNLYVPDGVTVSVKWITLLISILIGNVLTVGCCRFFVENREYQAPVSRVFHGFQGGHYVNTVWIMFLRDVKILLWDPSSHYSGYYKDIRIPYGALYCGRSAGYPGRRSLCHIQGNDDGTETGSMDSGYILYRMVAGRFVYLWACRNFLDRYLMYMQPTQNCMQSFGKTGCAAIVWDHPDNPMEHRGRHFKYLTKGETKHGE